jgi:hypothetical protein
MVGVSVRLDELQRAVCEIMKAYLRVHETQDPTPLANLMPAQYTGEHEQKDRNVGDRCGDDKDTGT